MKRFKREYQLPPGVDANVSGLPWTTSTRTGQADGVDDWCVDVAEVPDQNLILVGDTKDRRGPVLAFDRATWQNFVNGLKQPA